MTKKVCDRCGKDMTILSELRGSFDLSPLYPVSSVFLIKSPFHIATVVDLCPECTLELIEFLKPNDKRRTSDDETLQKAN